MAIDVVTLAIAESGGITPGYRFAPAYIIGVANHPESDQSVEA